MRINFYQPPSRLTEVIVIILCLKVSQGSPKQDGSVDALYGLGTHAQKSKTFISGIADWTGLPQSMTPIEIQRGKNEEPFAIRTRLGWTINGPPDWWKKRL